MNKKQVLANIAAVANRLDERGRYSDANELTKIMGRIANSSFDEEFTPTRPWWQNEAGEPLYSPEAIRAEEMAGGERGHDPEEYDGSDIDYNGYDDDDGFHEFFKSTYQDWEPRQKDLDTVEQMYTENQKHDFLKQWGPEIEKRKLEYPESFDEARFIANTFRPNTFSGDMERILDQLDDGGLDPEDMYRALDVAKNAVLSGVDITEAVTSFLKSGSYGGPNYQEDFGYFGDERLMGE